MAVDLQSTDSLWLSSESQFFTEENSSSNCNNKPINETCFSSSSSSSSSCFSSSDSGSALSSPVESEQGSTKSESDQGDDYTAELTRQMAHYMLQDDENRHENESRQALIDYQIKAIQIMKQKQESFCRGQRANGYNNKQQVGKFHQSKGRGFSGQKFSWPNLPQKQRTGSDMTAVFLGDHSGVKTGSCGTGVFLPRGIDNTCEPRKKSGCSPVLIPAKVVQALKLQFDRMGVESRFHGSKFPVQYDGLTLDASYGRQIQKKSQAWTEPAMNHQEMGLPQEWTY
ncbi:hypothetical protein JCGZ_02906 [Jatropha curcas]|uniref:Uncharacterized protein n=1 Tax=Jatropha curcas TaxID=180498 RepID=A0A067L142_JATCU|nr:uncharacterized protein LOC105629897 [Jatropha curcas]KDP42176.1 hypothetical protein JCGZ_02906 [Jatropha curcas]